MRSEESNHTIAIEFDGGIYFEQAVKSVAYDLDVAAHISLCGHNNTKFGNRVPGWRTVYQF